MEGSVRFHEDHFKQSGHTMVESRGREKRLLENWEGKPE